MKRFDVNCMIGSWVRDELFINNEEQFLQALDYFNIEQAVVYHAAARNYNPIWGNEQLLRLTQSQSKLIPCFLLSPHYKYDSGWSKLENLLLNHNIKFGKLYPKEHGYNLHCSHTRHIFEIASRLNMILIFDYSEITDSYGVESADFETLCREYPKVRVILAGARHRRNMVWYNYLENYPNVFVDFSLVDNWLAYEQVVRLFGSGNILWGSNMPFNSPGSAITMLSYADISDDDKENIAYQNLEKLMRGDSQCC